MSLEQVLEQVNVKNLEAPEIHMPKKKYLWDKIPASAISDAHERIKEYITSKPDKSGARSFASSLQLLNEHWKVPTEIKTLLKNSYPKIDSNTGYLQLFNTIFDLQVLAPDIAAQLTAHEDLQKSALQEFKIAVMQVKTDHGLELGTASISNIYTLLQARISFPTVDFPIEDTNSIKDIIHYYLDENEKYFKRNGTRVYSYLASAAVYKYLYSEEHYTPPEAMISNINQEFLGTKSIFDMKAQTYLFLKMLYADGYEYTENGLRFIMPEERFSNQIPPMPAVKKR